jgi:hypothetical protein
MKMHIFKLAKAIAAHHVAEGKRIKSAMESCEDDDEREELHKSLTRHTDVAEAATECMAACEKTSKAAGMHGDELEPVPEGLRFITPGVPQNVTAIPRTGSAPISKATVPAQFAHLVAVKSDEE